MTRIDLITWSQHQQDLFAYIMVVTDSFLTKPATKKFLDIGCRRIVDNNTYKLECLGWKGLLFDIDNAHVQFNNTYRESKAFCVDVTTDDFCRVFLDNPEYLDVDYITIDVDEAGLGALENLFIMGVRFKCITFEHDSCSFGDDIKVPSVKMFRDQGYELLFEDVGIVGPEWGWPWLEWGETPAPLEDWWIDPSFFNKDIMGFASIGELHFSIIEKLVKHLVKDGAEVENNGKVGAVLNVPSSAYKYKVLI